MYARVLVRFGVFFSRGNEGGCRRQPRMKELMMEAVISALQPSSDLGCLIL